MSDTYIKVLIKEDSDIILARQQGRLLASKLGFTGRDLTIIATAISELARNIIEFAEKGEIIISSGSKKGGDACGIQIVAADKGPGIPDIAKAMQDGYSTNRGLGMGLPGTKRLMDEFEIESKEGKGTKVSVRKWLP